MNNLSPLQVTDPRLNSQGLNSLGFAKTPAETRVVVAMSGGVDSSVVAAMLHEEGYEVIGITLQLYDHGKAVGKAKACCAGQDIYDASQVAGRLGIKHYVLDYESKFSEKVIADFADSYLRGETPLPCVRCNQNVKFKDLLTTAKELGADCLATGHYVRRVLNDQGQSELHRAHDPLKDQSYFLFATTQDQLDFLRFPLGGMEKSETRALAKKYGLKVADKPDSQDICFVPNGSYAAIVQKLRPGAIDPGEIVHLDGRVLGQHEGILNYTIGQRKGIKIGGIKGAGDVDPLFVIALNAEKRQVIVGPRSALGRHMIYLKDLNWLGSEDAYDQGLAVDLKIRSIQKPVSARIIRDKDRPVARVILDKPEFGVSPGQASVFYAKNSNRLLGGGWITGAE